MYFVYYEDSQGTDRVEVLESFRDLVAFLQTLEADSFYVTRHERH